MYLYVPNTGTSRLIQRTERLQIAIKLATIDNNVAASIWFNGTLSVCTTIKFRYLVIVKITTTAQLPAREHCVAKVTDY